MRPLARQARQGVVLLVLRVLGDDGCRSSDTRRLRQPAAAIVDVPPTAHRTLGPTTTDHYDGKTKKDAVTEISAACKDAAHPEFMLFGVPSHEGDESDEQGFFSSAMRRTADWTGAARGAPPAPNALHARVDIALLRRRRRWFGFVELGSMPIMVSVEVC